MGKDSVFRQLSITLPEEERKILLKKIQASLNLWENEKKVIYPKSLDKEEKDRLIKQDIQQSNWLVKLILWFKGFFSGKSPRDLYLDYRIHALKNKIKQLQPGLTGFETRNLTPKFAHLVFDLYVHTHHLIPLFKNIWGNPRLFEGAIMAFIDEHLINSISKLEEILNEQEMEELYELYQSKDAIRKVLLERLKRYVHNLGDEIFLEMEKEVIPLYYLKELVLFPFPAFFHYFHFQPSPTDTNPHFTNAAVMVAIDDIERLYYALYVANKIAEPFMLKDAFIKYFINFDENSEMITDHIFESNIKKLMKSSRFLMDAIPFTELIRYFRKDPYYQLLFYLPKLNLKSFFLSLLNVKFLTQLDESFTVTRLRVVGRGLDHLFENTRLSHFFHYREFSAFEYEKLGLPFFSHTKSLNLLYNYINWYYREYIQDMAQILARGILQHNKIALNRLLLSIANIEDLEDKIREFDMSLSVDTEEGKIFHVIRRSLTADLSQQRMYRSLVNRKDKEAKILMDRGRDTLLNLQRILVEILANKTESWIAQLKVQGSVAGKPLTYEKNIQNVINHIREFLHLFDQLVMIEKGS